MSVRITADELVFEAKLQAYFDKHRAKWEAADERRGRPPTQRELDERLLWESMIEDVERDRFWGLGS